MKKGLLIIFVNIFLIVLALIILDWCLFAKKFYMVYGNYTGLLTTSRFENNLPYDKTKPPILTIGCSFVYGTEINDNETLAYQLQKLTKRKVYNYGYQAQGVQHVVYKLQDSPVFKEQNIVPEYVIYVFITDHLNRMYLNHFTYDDPEKYIRYHVKDNKLERDLAHIVPSDYIKRTLLARSFNKLMFKHKSDKTKFDFLKLHLEKAQKAMLKINPNAKFVIVVYHPEAFMCEPFYTDRWKELEEEGFIVIRFDSDKYNYLLKDEYIAPDHVHPSGKAWQVLVPIIAEKLGLKK